MERLFFLFIALSIIWSVIKKLKEAKQRQLAGEPTSDEAEKEPEERPVSLTEMLRRELERQREEEAARKHEPPAIALPPEETPQEEAPVPPAPEPVQKPEFVAERIEKPKPRKGAYRLLQPTKAMFDLPLDANAVKRGITLAEILGPCRAVRPSRARPDFS